MFVRSEAVRFSRRDSRLVVEALDGALGEAAAGGEPGEQLASMATEGEGELLERLQARAQRHGRPARDPERTDRLRNAAP